MPIIPAPRRLGHFKASLTSVRPSQTKESDFCFAAVAFWPVALISRIYSE